MAWTRKPCPMCKEVSYQRDPADICQGCKDRVADLERFRDETMKKRGKMSSYIICAYPYFSTGSYRSDKTKIQDAFRDLVLLFGAPSEKLVRYLTGGDAKPYLPAMKVGSQGYGADQYRDMTKKQAEAVQLLYDEITKYGDECRAAGFEAGNDLIVRLAAGKVSLVDFEKEVKEETEIKDQ
jgi:hypothetical protein